MNPANSPKPASPPNQDAIDVLYDKIGNDPQFLEEIDKIPFVETPLHTAATDGDIRLVTEVIRLKPSFAWKLNPQGLSPVHLALQNGHFSVGRRFVSINKELVRVKGKKGLTPLHHAAEKGHTEILAEFLTACPDSIEDLTVEGETALHIAVKEGQFEALQVLVGWLRRSSYDLRDSVLNRKNESGETILHVSTRKRDVQAVKLLIRSGIKVNAKNWEGSTALDIVEMREFSNAEIKSMLVNAKAKRGTNVNDAPTFAKRLASKFNNSAEIFWGIRDAKIDDTARNVLLAVAVLIATMTYQSVLSPPGGVYQGDASAASANSNNSTLLVGKSVMSIPDFVFFSALNTSSLFLSSIAIIFLPLPAGLLSFPIVGILLYYWVGYIKGMSIISPSDVPSKVHIYTSIGMVGILCMSVLQLFRTLCVGWLESMRENKETESGGNRW